MESPPWDPEVPFPYCRGIISKFGQPAEWPVFFYLEVLAAKVWDCREVLPSLLRHAGHWENQKTVGAAVLTNEGQNGGGYSQMRPRHHSFPANSLSWVFSSNSLC